MQIPTFGTLLKICALAAAIVGGAWTANEIRDRRTLIDSLHAYAISHADDEPVVRVLVDCNMNPIVSVDACSAKLLEKFGPDVMKTLSSMADAGAFTPNK